MMLASSAPWPALAFGHVLLAAPAGFCTCLQLSVTLHMPVMCSTAGTQPPGLSRRCRHCCRRHCRCLQRPCVARLLCCGSLQHQGRQHTSLPPILAAAMGKDKGDKTPKDKSAKKEKKDKSAKKEKAATEEQPVEVAAEAAVAPKTALAPIAKPLADDKLAKKVRRARAGPPCVHAAFSAGCALCAAVACRVKHPPDPIVAAVGLAAVAAALLCWLHLLCPSVRTCTCASLHPPPAPPPLPPGAQAGQEGGQAEADQAGGEGGDQGHPQEGQGVRPLCSLPAGMCPLDGACLVCGIQRSQLWWRHVPRRCKFWTACNVALSILSHLVCSCLSVLPRPASPRSVCLIAGDISPIDVITPLPVLCEDNDIPYIYVPSKASATPAAMSRQLLVEGDQAGAGFVSSRQTLPLLCWAPLASHPSCPHPHRLCC